MFVSNQGYWLIEIINKENEESEKERIDQEEGRSKER